MPVETDADRAVFFDPEEFGVTVVWLPPGAIDDDVLGDVPWGDGLDLEAAPSFNAIFARPTLRTLADGDAAPLLDRSATLLCRESDLPADAAPDDPVAIGADQVAYICRTIEPDGTGLVNVTLQKAR